MGDGGLISNLVGLGEGIVTLAGSAVLGLLDHVTGTIDLAGLVQFIESLDDDIDLEIDPEAFAAMITNNVDPGALPIDDAAVLAILATLDPASFVPELNPGDLAVGRRASS